MIRKIWLTLLAVGVMGVSVIAANRATAASAGIAMVDPYNPVISTTPITVTIGGGPLNAVRDPVTPALRSPYQP